MSTPVITVENLSKAYRIGLKEEIADTLVGAMTSWIKAPVRNFNRLRRLNTFRAGANGDDEEEDIIWALKDVSFEVQEGEVLGIIGRNGAGKSTLLKILSRITEPTSGRAVIRGRVSSLLEVGTGFHPEMTGRENVYMNGTILGMTKREIDRKFDEIVDFSGVDKFLDTPIKRYSSGMKVRLAFSVAAHLEPEILIIDEVLAVGDAEFQKKCLGKMHDVAKGGRTVLFVSHSLPAIQELCCYALWLHFGNVLERGPCSSVVRSYIESFADMSQLPIAQRTDRTGTAHVKLTDLYVRNSGGKATTRIRSGESCTFELVYSCAGPATAFVAAIGLIDTSRGPLFQLNSEFTKVQLRAEPGPGRLTCTVPRLPLAAGSYHVNVALTAPGYKPQFDHIQSAMMLDVLPGDFFRTGVTPHRSVGAFLVEHNWCDRDEKRAARS